MFQFIKLFPIILFEICRDADPDPAYENNRIRYSKKTTSENRHKKHNQSI